MKSCRVITNIFCRSFFRSKSRNYKHIFIYGCYRSATNSSFVKYNYLKTMPAESESAAGNANGNDVNVNGSGVRLNWNLTAAEIEKKTNELITDTKYVYDTVGSLKQEDVTYANTLQALAEHEAVYASTRSEVDFMQHVSSNQELRDASVMADKKISDFEVEISMRQDVYDNLSALNVDVDTWSPETVRFHERLIKMGKRNGLHLSESLQAEIKEINKKMSELSIDFSKNLNEEDTHLEFSRTQLDGLPEDLLKTLERTEAGLCKVSLKYTHYFPVMKFVHSGETRKALEKAFHSMCMKENTLILEELVQLRQKKASLLGFNTHAQFILDMRMAKTADNVAKFLSELKEKLQPLKKEELSLFLQYKKEICEKLGCEFDGKINMWDLRYYMTRAEERKYAVDQNLLKLYFPLDVVTKGLLDIYQELLGLEFSEVKGCEVWHKDVRMYSVTDSGTLLGYFYLDLFPRTGKYGHAACFGLQPGCIVQGSTRQVAVAAMVANFTKPTTDAPSLLTHDEVETFFHEFGHVMHQICAQAHYALFSGTSVERDFVEAPSQMLENWVWQKESLKRLSTHYQTRTPIPDDLLDSLIASRVANAGVFNLRQILLATFDQTIHSSQKVDTAKLYSELCVDILGIPATEDTNMAASFRHLAGGYDAQYYGYLWSEVFSADMFYSYFTNSPMNTQASMKYRRCILEPGGSLDGEVMLQNFLGRQPQQDAFLRSKGLAVNDI